MKASDVINSINNPAANIDINYSLLDILTQGGFSIVNLAFFFVGLSFFASLVIAAFNYILGEGSPDKIAKSNSRILNSLLGLTIVLISFVLVKLILAIMGLESEAPF